MSYFIMDLTGENPAYKVPNCKKRIVTSDQVVYFFTPVYLDTIEITIEGTVTTPMVKDIDWTVMESDYDYEAMGRAQLQDKKWSEPLVKSITILKPFVDPYTINCAYQQLYPNIIGYILQNPTENIEITPEVFAQLLKDVENLKLATAPIEDAHAAAERKPMLLPPDPNKEYSTNVIDGEVWQVDTSAGKKIIFPVAGAFYRDSIILARGKFDSVDDINGPDDLFIENVDYVITGVDSYGTHNTSNTSGVYNLIIFTTAYIGDVTVCYHAYGGIPTQYDVRALYESLTNVYNWVTSADVLTANTVGSTAIMVEFRARLNALEDAMRSLATSGKPSYGDATSGTCVTKRITATDTNFHWWTIATLYKVAGSDTVFTADIGHFQIQSLYTKMLLDFIVAVDINKPDGQQLTVTSLASNAPEGYVPFVDDSQIEQILRPQLRIIYNKNSIQGSGISLQLGLRLRGVSEETLAIADLSGIESSWKIVDADPAATRPQDDSVQLPSENHLWSIDNPDSYQETNLIPMIERGHLVWAGSEPLNRPTSGVKTINLAHFLETEVDLSKLKTVRCYLEESQSNRFIVELPLCGTNDAITAVGTFTYANKAGSLVYQASRHPGDGTVTMTINAEVVAGLNSNQLNLRYVTVNS